MRRKGYISVTKEWIMCFNKSYFKCLCSCLGLEDHYFWRYITQRVNQSFSQKIRFIVECNNFQKLHSWKEIIFENLQNNLITAANTTIAQCSFVHQSQTYIFHINKYKTDTLTRCDTSNFRRFVCSIMTWGFTRVERIAARQLTTENLQTSNIDLVQIQKNMILKIF